MSGSYLAKENRSKFTSSLYQVHFKFILNPLQVSLPLQFPVCFKFSSEANKSTSNLHVIW